MSKQIKVGPPNVIDHQLAPFLPEFNLFNSTRELENSALYSKLENDIERVLGSVVQENLAPKTSSSDSRIRASAWNIERGVELEGLLEVFSQHHLLKNSDIFLLTELDHGMARTKNLFIAHEIAKALSLNYAFAPCYIALDKGSGLESTVDGENTKSFHGNALFSRHPISKAHSIALPNGRDLMRGKEKRLGTQRAVAAIINHPSGAFWAVSLHLDAHSTQKHRHLQMTMVLDHLENLNPTLPVLIGGDWNTSTHNSSRALYSILGYCRRVLMGVQNILKNHYPHPNRWFERKLFRELELRNYQYRDLNEMGACTLHYDIQDLAANNRMADWIPNWCFWFINWALGKNGGYCSMKLDWFAGKNLFADPDSKPQVLSEVHDKNKMLSDHDPIILDFRLNP